VARTHRGSGVAAFGCCASNSDGSRLARQCPDATEEISVMKSDAMAAFVKECAGCSVLEVVDTPLASVSTRIPQMTQSLQKRFGKKWTHSLAINDGFFDFMAPPLGAAGVPGSGPPINISGGGIGGGVRARRSTRRFGASGV
jgi:ribose transport system substrate-binding protein